MSHFNAGHIWDDASCVERSALRKSAWLQVLMPADKTFFERYLPGTHIIHIPNIVPQYGELGHVGKKDIYRIIDVARLDMKQKRQHILVEAFAKVADAYPKWNLELWGEEQENDIYTNQLLALIEKYQLKGRAFLCGNAEDVKMIYQAADIFAFPSSYEGFPLAMTEAMSAGLPVVAYRTCPAVNELVQSGENGLLVDDDIDALAAGLRRLMDNEQLRLKMGKRASEMMKSYSSKVIWDRWEQLIIKTSKLSN